MRREDSILLGFGAEPPRQGGDPAQIDWDYLLRTSADNRLDGIVFNALDRLGVLAEAPEPVRRALEERYRRIVETVSLYIHHAGELAERFRAAGLRMIVLRGPALGLTIYEKPYLRPFRDLDILIPREEIGAAKEVLDNAGFVPEKGLLPDPYFEKHHLHLRRIHARTGAAVELHWAFDHPYAPTLVDIPSLFLRARPAGDAAAPLPVLDPVDALITLCLHLCKHCIFLGAFTEEKDFPSLLTGERSALWLIDIEKARKKLDGDSLARARGRAAEWSLAGNLTVCLRAAERIFGGTTMTEGGAPAGMNRWEKAVSRRRMAFLRGEGGGTRIDRFLFGLRPDTIFRPVRALSLARCVFPPADYLRKRYGDGVTAKARILHAARTGRRLTGNLTDYLRERWKARKQGNVGNAHRDQRGRR
jgi:hypothetical protein